MKKHLLVLLALFTAAQASWGAGEIFREPFTLNLHIDKERYYEEKFDKIPFVHNGAIYLFKGEKFGVKVDFENGLAKAVSYTSNIKEADIVFEFSQEISNDGGTTMLLKTQNNTNTTINLDALMTVPGKETILRTTILPLEPKMGSYESWPHPIIQLVLTKLRTAS